MDITDEIVTLYKSKRIKIEDYSKSNKELKNYKNGVYAFYSKDGLLYIGMVSNADTASLYARMYGNGNAKHEIKKWFSLIDSAYFYKLDTDEKYDIQILERLLIRELKPSENDLIFDEEDLIRLLEEIKR